MGDEHREPFRRLLGPVLPKVGPCHPSGRVDEEGKAEKVWEVEPPFPVHEDVAVEAHFPADKPVHRVCPEPP